MKIQCAGRNQTVTLLPSATPTPTPSPTPTTPSTTRSTASSKSQKKTTTKKPSPHSSSGESKELLEISIGKRSSEKRLRRQVVVPNKDDVLLVLRTFSDYDVIMDYNNPKDVQNNVRKFVKT